VPDKWPSAKSLFAVNFFSEGSLPRAVLGKAFAEGFWAFAECPGPSTKRAPPVVNHHSHHHHAQNGGDAAGYMGCRLLPTGCIVQDMNNGYSKVRTPARPLPWLCSTAVRFDCRHKSARRSGMWRLQCASYDRI